MITMESRRSQNLLHETVNIAKATLLSLHGQGEQLEHTLQSICRIEDKQVQSVNLLRKLQGKWFKKRQKKSAHTTTPARPLSENIDNNLEPMSDALNQLKMLAVSMNNELKKHEDHLVQIKTKTESCQKVQIYGNACLSKIV